MMIIMFNNFDIVMKEQQKQSPSDILLHLFINNSSDGGSARMVALSGLRYFV